MIGAIPVVGTEEVGYQPVISNPQSGAVLQVTPQLLPNSQAVLLDICSSVTRAEGPVEPIHFLGSETAGTKREAPASQRPRAAIPPLPWTAST